MKKKVMIYALAIGIMPPVYSQLPGINKVKVPKIKKEEKTPENPEVNTETTPASDPKDDEAKTQRAYYFNDKNGELSALYNIGVGRYDQAGYFCREVLRLNPSEVKKNIADSESKWPDTYNENFWVVSEFKPRLSEFGKNWVAKQSSNFEIFTGECDAFINEGNYVKALKVARYNDSLVQSMAAFEPENATVIDMKKKSEEKINSIIQKLSVYHSSPFHSKNAGKILFSKNAIVAGGETESAMTTAFNETDNMYVAVYLEGRLKDYDKEMMFVRVQQAGLNYCISMEFPVTNENENQSVIMIPLICPPSESKSTGTYDVVKMLADNAKAGETRLTVSVLNNNQRLQLERGELYTAEVTLNVTDGSALKKVFDEYYKQMVAAARIPAPVITNAKLEADAKKVSTGLFIGNITPLRVTLQENWNLEYDDYGSPYYRYLRAFVAIKDNNTNKCYYQMMKIGQDYIGGGNYGETYLYDPSAPADLNEIECGNVNK